jgi:hypothetical protein
MNEIQWWEKDYQPGWPPESQTPDWWPLWEKSDGRCEYCGLDATEDPRYLALLESDHLVPRQAGGSDGRFNLIFCCKVCNLVKHWYDPSHGKGSPTTEEERKALVEDAKAEIARRINDHQSWEYPHYFRVWQLTILAKRLQPA